MLQTIMETTTVASHAMKSWDLPWRRCIWNRRRHDSEKSAGVHSVGNTGHCCLAATRAADGDDDDSTFCDHHARGKCVRLLDLGVGL